MWVLDGCVGCKEYIEGTITWRGPLGIIMLDTGQISDLSLIKYQMLDYGHLLHLE